MPAEDDEIPVGLPDDTTGVAVAADDDTAVGEPSARCAAAAIAAASGMRGAGEGGDTVVTGGDSTAAKVGDRNGATTTHRRLRVLARVPLASLAIGGKLLLRGWILRGRALLWRERGKNEGAWFRAMNGHEKLGVTGGT
jgi:hypothetical protein